MTNKCKCGSKLPIVARAQENDGAVCKNCGSTYAFVNNEWHFQVGHNPFEAGMMATMEPGIGFAEALLRGLQGIGAETPASEAKSWVPDKVSLQAALRELEHRPHQNMFPFMDIGSPYCKCGGCKTERRRLIKELQNSTCENRE
jgi:hypothetical protein